MTDSNITEFNATPGDEAQLLSLIQAASENQVPVTESSAEPSDVAQLDEADPGSNTPQLVQPLAVESNGESIVLQQGQDPETGEIMYFLQDENGQHIAVTPENLANLGIQVASAGTDDLVGVAVSQPDNETTTDSVSVNLDGVRSELVAVTLDGLTQLSESTTLNIPNATPSIADTNVVQSIDTPKMSIPIDTEAPKEDQPLEAEKALVTENSVDVNSIEAADNEESVSGINNLMTENPVPEAIPETQENVELNENQTETSIEQLQNCAPTFEQSGIVQVDHTNGNSMEDVISAGQGQENIVIMTEDGNTEINLADLVNAGGGGQTIFIETPDGLIACSAPESDSNQQLQLVDDNIVLTSETGLGDAQLFQTASGQTVTYTVSPSGSFELATLGNMQAKLPSPKKTNIRPAKGKSSTAASISTGETLLVNKGPASIAPKPAIQMKKKTVTITGKLAPKAEVSSDSSQITVTRISPTKSIAPSHSMGSLGTPSGSAITATAPGPSQLASSRRTYSKKNIVWLNPDQSNNQDKNSTFVKGNTPSSTSKQEVTPELKKSSVAPLIKTTKSSTTPDVRSVSPVKSQPIVAVTTKLTPSPVVKVNAITSIKTKPNEESKKLIDNKDQNGVVEAKIKETPLVRSNIKRNRDVPPLPKEKEKHEIIVKAIPSTIKISPIKPDVAEIIDEKSVPSVEKISPVEDAKSENKKEPEEQVLPKRRGRKPILKSKEENPVQINNVELATKIDEEASKKITEDSHKIELLKSNDKVVSSVEENEPANVESTEADSEVPAVTPKRRGRPPKKRLSVTEEKPLKDTTKVDEQPSESSEGKKIETPVEKTVAKPDVKVAAKKSEKAVEKPADKALSKPENKVSVEPEEKDIKKTEETASETSEEVKRSDNVDTSKANVVKVTESATPIVTPRRRGRPAKKRPSVDVAVAPIESTFKLEIDEKSTEKDAEAKSVQKPVVDKKETTPSNTRTRRSTRVAVTTDTKDKVESEAIDDVLSKAEPTPANPDATSTKQADTSLKPEGSSLKPEAAEPDVNGTKKRVGFQFTDESPESSTPPAKKRRGRPPVTPAASRNINSKLATPNSILKTPASQTGRISYSTPIPATPELHSFSEVDPDAEIEELQRSVTSLSDSRTEAEFYDYSDSDCSFHIRHQSTSLTNFSPRESGGSYVCQKCGYRTSRLNNLVWHHKDIQCPVVKNQVMLSWENEIKKLTKSPVKDDKSSASSKRAELSTDDDDDLVNTYEPSSKKAKIVNAEVSKVDGDKISNDTSGDIESNE